MQLLETKCDDFVMMRILVFANFFQTMLITGARNRRVFMKMQKEAHSVMFNLFEERPDMSKKTMASRTW